MKVQSRKFCNHNLLTHDALNNYNYNEEENSLVWDIASQCPFVGGNAVLEARKFLMNFSDSINWDDKVTCEEAGYYKLLQQQSNNSSSVYVIPNPAKDNVSILYPFENNKDYIIEVYDLIGKLVLIKQSMKNLPVVSLKTEQLQNGCYHFRILDFDKTIITSGKFVVAKW